MNSFATLSLIYAIFTLISSFILLVYFRKKLDDSAIYFLFSELCMGITCTVIFLINRQLIVNAPIWTAIPNFCNIAAEISVFFSIASLTRKVEKKWFFFATIAVALLALLIELMRDQVAIEMIVWLFAGTITSLFISNYIVCRFKLPTVLSNNEFMKLFTWLELGLVVFGLIRISATFLSAPVLPRYNPSDVSVLIFSMYIVLACFRYFAYLGIRMTFIDPSNPTSNRLNKPLAKALEEKDQLLQGLIASNRVIGISALASSLAHQLSQPLTTIALRADTTRRDLLQSGQDPRIIASIDEIAAQSSKLSALVKNLRKFFDTQTSDFVQVNLQSKINEIIEIVEPNLGANRILLTKEYLSSPIVFGDSIQIQQALINVLNNSIDALVASKAKHKEIFIGISSIGGIATITVKDCGGGINPQLMPSVFELYKTTKKEGLGVGLWLSRTIMTQHHGTMTVSNEPEGWAVFKMNLPIYQSTKQALN
jgi:signal transduction histidine kinase